MQGGVRRLRQWIETAWYDDSAWLLPIVPLGWLTSGIARLRRKVLSGKTSPPIPVIVVGNISAGGTGKTPLVAALCEAARARGLHAIVISRGYGARPAHFPWQVAPGQSATVAGDEPLMLATFHGISVIIDPVRPRALARALAEGADLVISDDGLQHFALPRSLNIAVLDGERLLGNGRCLPAGPLRESASVLQQMDSIVLTGSEKGLMFWPHAVVQTLKPSPPVRIIDGKPLPLTLGQKVHAVAGIGNPARFFSTLESLGYAVIPHAFPDHYRFCKQDICFDDEMPVIMTAKDAVKCLPFVTSYHGYLPVRAILPASFSDDVFARCGIST